MSEWVSKWKKEQTYQRERVCVCVYICIYIYIARVGASVLIGMSKNGKDDGWFLFFRFSRDEKNADKDRESCSIQQANISIKIK